MNKGKPKKFTLRKLSVGVVSLGAGVMLFGSASETVKADTVSNEETANTVTSPSILSSPVASTVSSVSSNEEETRTLTDGSSTATVAASPVNVSRESATPVVGETVEKTEVATPAAIRGLDASSSSIPSTTSTVNQNIQEVKNLYEAELTNKSKTVKDENGILTKKEQKELFEIKKEVIDVGNDELEVKTTIDFKDIDYGAEVIILLDTSSKMTEESFNEAEIKIQQIVDTLTGNVSNRNLNTVRLITFNKEVDNPIMLLDKGSLVDKQNKQLSVNHLKNKINEGKYQKADGVALQAAIHRARELFKNEKQGSKNYLKRQHIILFTQGEATYSYDLSEKFKKENSDKNLPYIKDTKNKKVDYTNPYSLLPYEASVAESSMLNDLKLLIKRLKSLGIDVSKVEEKIKTVDLTVGVALQGLSWIGVKPLDYLFLKEFDGLKMKEKDFNYNSKQVGEGKHFQSYYERRTLKGGEQIINTIAQNIKAEILKGKKSRDTIKNSTVVFDKLKGYSNSWLPFGVESVNEVIEWTKNKTKEGLEWTEQKYEDF
ncbi:VWA domain-containing protein [Streptococcus didelphis]|nr:VWA domain-containing protein [Streptococcus didelphis]WMB29820.1 VWA domain-containing protein [Streptococcus didelphis]